jgi:3-deoxy-D-manno-octulosonic-acid transferase
MPRWSVLLLYNLAVPWFFLLALPGWLVKMARRGGYGTGLLERIGIYRRPKGEEPRGVVAVQAVSVGEVGIATKLIRAWRKREPARCFLLAVGTATGRGMAETLEKEGVRVVYAPLDLPGLTGRFLKRFSPEQMVLIESEIWPNLLASARRRGIPVRLANARLSPRSERRYRMAAGLVAPLLGMIDRLGAQEPEDRTRWAGIGIDETRITVTGSVKFDPAEAKTPARRAEFAAMIDAFGAGRPVVLAASTHAGEEAWIAKAVRAAAPGALCVLVPRHAERRQEVRTSLEAAGFEVVLRSDFRKPDDPARACLVVDSTGELRDWTAHAALVVVGKSILGRGGQNPAEAVLAGIPFACGPHMTNFRPLIDRIINRGGCFVVETPESLGGAVRTALAGGENIGKMTQTAREVLTAHTGATKRTIEMLETRSSETIQNRP